MKWRVLVQYKGDFTDHRGRHLAAEWRHAGLPALKGLRTAQAYELEGDLSEEDVRLLSDKLLADPITQEAAVSSGGKEPKAPRGRRARVWYKPGVSDPVADTVRLGARDLGFTRVAKARSGAAYEFEGKASEKDVRRFCAEHLMNALVQEAEVL
jgi:phosphoribosylformylglycinamidine (FGAM) synthase PurS component